MRRVSLRGLLVRRTRLALTALSVALGVTLISGTYVFTDTINASFDAIFQQSYRQTDAVVTPRRPAGQTEEDQLPTLPDGLLARVRAVPGVSAAEGTVFSMGATYVGPDGEELGSGFAPRFIASRVEDARFSVLAVARGRMPERAGEVALLQDTLDEAGLEVGDAVGVQAQTPRREYEIVGGLTFAGVDSFGGAVVGLFTLPEAQRLAGLAGRFDEISVAAAPGVTPAELKRRLRGALPERATVRTGTEQAASQSADIRENLGFLRTALLAFAGISLFVGAFIIFNTFSITVVQRSREFALLRTLGATRRQVMAAVLGEGLAIGALGSLAGLGLGLLLAQGLQVLFDSIGATLPSSGTVVAARTVVVALLVGIVVTVLSSLVPALRATRVAPVAALREGAILPPARSARFLPAIAVGLTVLAIGVLCVGLFGGLESGPALSLVGGGSALAFLGIALLSPRLVPPIARALAWPMERLWGITGRLAGENARRQPGRTAATAAALMVGVALVAFASIFASSARTTFRGTFSEGLRAQIVVQNTNGFGSFTPAAAGVLEEVPGVGTVTRVRYSHTEILGEDRPVTGVDPATFAALYDVGEGAELLARLGPGTAVVSEELAEELAHRPLRVRTPDARTRTLRVLGVVDDSLLTGHVTVSNATLAEVFGADRDGYLFATTTRDPEAVRAEAARRAERPFPQVEVLTKEGWVDDQVAQIDQLLTLIYALLALSVLVALFGIVNTLVLSITERTRELGLLRAIGTSRRQIRAMVRAEAVITALIGGILGIVLGTGLAVLVGSVLDDFTLDVPVVGVAVLLLLAALAGVLAAVLPARRAARLDVLQALAYE